MNAAPSPGRQVHSPNARSESVARRPFVAPAHESEALGIVIRSGAPSPKPVRFWAYLWAADDEDAMEKHWHERVPAEHAA
jgi:hypothetical protein